MFTLDDVLQSFLQPPRLNSRFEDTIKTFRKSHHEEWEDRVTRCSKSILTAACFRETAIASRESSDSMIYQPIGLYYAMYHLSMAMCWINPRLKCTELRGMQHSRLLGILKSQFVQGRLIDESIVDTFLALKNIREECNYQFCFREDLDHEMQKAVCDTELAFDHSFVFIHQVLHATDSLFRLLVGIGDGFGDDILNTYLSKEHKENVNNYLVLYSLTT